MNDIIIKVKQAVLCRKYCNQRMKRAASVTVSSPIKGHGIVGEAVFHVFQGLNIKVRCLSADLEYQSHLTDADFIANPRKYQFVCNTKKLYYELITNQKLQLTPQGVLIVKVDLIYKEEWDQFIIDIPMQRIEDKTSASKSKIKNDYQAEDHLSSQQNHGLDRKYPHRRRTRVLCPEHVGYNLQAGKLTKDNSLLTALTDYALFFYLSPMLPAQIYLFKIKIVKTAQRNIQIGYTTEQDPCFQAESVCSIALNDGYFHYGKSQAATGYDVSRIKKGSLITFKIDLRKRVVFWYHGRQIMCQMGLKNTADGNNIMPLIRMGTAGDQIELIKE